MKDDIKYKLGRNIKIERIRKDITQERFAELIDIEFITTPKFIKLGESQ